MLRHAGHVVEKLRFGISAEVRGLDFRGRKIGHKCLDVVDAVISHADRPGGEAAVAAGFLLGCGFQHENFGAALARRQCCAEGGVTRAHYNHVGYLLTHQRSRDIRRLDSYSAA